MTNDEEAANEFTEDQVPEDGLSGDVSDNAEPRGSKLVEIRTKPVNLRKHLADTRRYIGYAIVGATIVLYLGLTAALLFGLLSLDGFTKVIAALSPLQALAAATIGFFFGKHDD